MFDPFPQPVCRARKAARPEGPLGKFLDRRIVVRRFGLDVERQIGQVGKIRGKFARRIPRQPGAVQCRRATAEGQSRRFPPDRTATIAAGAARRRRLPRFCFGSTASCRRAAPQAGRTSLPESRSAAQAGRHNRTCADIDRDVIARGGVAVLKQRMQSGLAGNTHIALFEQFLRKRLLEGLARLHAAPRQMPARRIAVTNEQHFVAAQHDATHAERHAAPQAPIKMQESADHWIVIAKPLALRAFPARQERCSRSPIFPIRTCRRCRARGSSNSWASARSAISTGVLGAGRITARTS